MLVLYLYLAHQINESSQTSKISSTRPWLVSDEPLSSETNYRTEFVAVLNNQPQGGFLMRRPTVNVPVASGNGWGNDGFGFFFQRNWNSQLANRRQRAGQYYQPMQQRW
ncbi:MAG TPA: hypothetical protein VG498_24170 [Terriglobales bacterium]|nr:hypothetical protein [Terriglobales bacterium]